MTFTYGGDPSRSPLEAVRYLLGDTEPAEPLTTDEEITWVMEEFSDKTPYYQAAQIARNIAARLAREVSFSSDGQSVSLSEIQQKYTLLAKDLMDQHDELAGEGASVIVGGMLVNEYIDPTVKPFAFGTGMHDNPDAGQQDFGYGPDDYPLEW